MTDVAMSASTATSCQLQELAAKIVASAAEGDADSSAQSILNHLPEVVKDAVMECLQSRQAALIAHLSYLV